VRSTVYAPPLDTRWTTLDGPATVRIFNVREGNTLARSPRCRSDRYSKEIRRVLSSTNALRLAAERYPTLCDAAERRPAERVPTGLRPTQHKFSPRRGPYSPNVKVVPLNGAGA
jgi:hypothetical protein